MRKQLLVLVAILTFTGTVHLDAAEHDHTGHGMNYLGNNSPNNAHQEVVDGIKATFNVKTMAEAMKDMGMEMPKGVKETHHIAVSFNDMKTGRSVEKGEVTIKVQAPDKSEQTKDLPAMHGHFGADFEMKAKGKYGVMSKFKLPDGKVRSAKFWYTVK